MTPTRRCGHPATPDNTIVQPNGYGRCRKCKLATGRRHSKKMRDEMKEEKRHPQLLAWTEEEDDILIMGMKNEVAWNILAQDLPGRSRFAAARRWQAIRDDAPVEEGSRREQRYSSDALLRAMIRYGVRHGHLLSMPHAQIAEMAGRMGIAPLPTGAVAS